MISLNSLDLLLIKKSWAFMVQICLVCLQWSFGLHKKSYTASYCTSLNVKFGCKKTTWNHYYKEGEQLCKLSIYFIIFNNNSSVKKSKFFNYFKRSSSEGNT